MESGKKEVAEAENGKIVLRLNSHLDPGPCAVCGAECHPDGFDFCLEGTAKLVCTDCVRLKAPELAFIHDGAHQWAESAKEKSWHEGVKEGKEQAGHTILETIEESPVDRIKRICFTELGVVEDVPF